MGSSPISSMHMGSLQLCRCCFNRHAALACHAVRHGGGKRPMQLRTVPGRRPPCADPSAQRRACKGAGSGLGGWVCTWARWGGGGRMAMAVGSSRAPLQRCTPASGAEGVRAHGRMRATLPAQNHACHYPIRCRPQTSSKLCTSMDRCCINCVSGARVA